MSTLTITGNLTQEPEIRYTRDGHARATFSVASNRRWQDRDTGEPQETTSYFDVVCWRELAENVCLTLRKGHRVVVTGTMEQRSWDNGEGERRSRWELTASDVGLSLRFATAEAVEPRRPKPTTP